MSGTGSRDRREVVPAHALPHLSERVTHFCARLDAPTPRVFLSDAALVGQL